MKQIRNFLITATIFTSLLIFLNFGHSVVRADVLDASDTQIEDKKPSPEEEVDSNIDEPEDLEPPMDKDNEEFEDDYNDEGEIESPYELSLEIGTQSAWSKEVPVYLNITPLVNSSRTEIRWDSGFGIEFDPQYQNMFALDKGETGRYRVNVIPRKDGSYVITASVTNWGYGRNYTSSKRIDLVFDENLITEPRTSGYTFSLVLKYLTYLLILVVLLVGGFFLAKYGLTWLKQWLKPIEY